jgi:(1->4)-alpha-D-glucan 1-alpha-D-glucosylmutase
MGPRRGPELRATYRVQLRPGFGFDAAAAVVPYLARLGISHLYASPITQAAPGSEHGYDVADPTRISEALGGAAGLGRLVEALHRADMGLLVDIVPNHMSTDPGANPWWADVLEAGMESPYAPFFDIEWEPPWPELRHRVLVPVLGDSPEVVAARGELALERGGGRVYVAHHRLRLPLDPATLVELLETAAAQPGAAVLCASARLAAAGFGRGEPGLAARRRWWEELGATVASSSPAAAALDATLRHLSSDPAALLALCGRQHWLIASWRDAAERLNHRRFFTITSLVGVRVEDPRVFDAVHGLVRTLAREGCVDGLRIDHIDGLRDPGRYLERLGDVTGAGWVVVEKILERGERLPAAWRTCGTTGYEFAALLDGISVDPAGLARLTDLCAGFTGHTESWAHCVHRARLEVLRGGLRADVTRLAARLARVAVDAGIPVSHGSDEVGEVLTAVIAELGVYRTYVDPVGGTCSPEDAARVVDAVDRARRRLPAVRPELLDVLSDALRGRRPGEGLELAARVQQLTPAVMAKGKEDTALYRWPRLLALNEVGGDPGTSGLGVAAFHTECEGWMRGGDRGLRATSTHDTKRSEDVRARLCVLSEIPERWAEAARRWSAATAPRRSRLVDPDTEYILYQTLVGAHPIDAGRLTSYMEKATREAGVHTGWTSPNADYDAAVHDFAVAVLEDSAVMDDVAAFVEPVAAAGRRLSLAWTLLKLTAPGVPDVYQGTELWDLSLVDPDNRRPVDFDARRRLLARVEAGPPVDGMEDGSAKLRLIQRALAVRRELPDALAAGAAYLPLRSAGRHAGRLVGFARGEPAATVTVADRRGWEPAGGWGTTTVALPPGRWRDRLDGGGDAAHEGEVAVPVLLGARSAALLVRA